MGMGCACSKTSKGDDVEAIKEGIRTGKIVGKFTLIFSMIFIVICHFFQLLQYILQFQDSTEKC